MPEAVVLFHTARMPDLRRLIILSQGVQTFCGL